MSSPDLPGTSRPEAAAETDALSPHSPPLSSHAPSAEEERERADWEGIAAMPEFRALLARKRRFIVAGTVFFLVYYFALPVLVGYFPKWMEQKVGPVNLAYLFAFSQFIMAWVVAGAYVKTAAGWDRAAHGIIQKAEGK